MTFPDSDPSADEKDNASSPSRAPSHRLSPFADLLYEEGDPARAEQDEGEATQTPLYDSLCGLEQRYTDHILIAQGGMKEIYRALDLKTSRHVAFARPLPHLGKDHYDAFLREAHLTAKLDHPGIIKLFGMDVDPNGRPFFTMEFKTGKSLRTLLKDYTQGRASSAWPIAQRLSIILRVCESLSYAHSQRVLHLDIKPDNIQVGSFGEVQLCDWGMGVVMQGEDRQQSDTLLDPDLYGSLQRNIKGTPAYMAPELFDSMNPKTVQMDIYALGCLIEELLNAQAPEPGLDEPLSKDSPLHAVVAKAKAKNPNDRYRTVANIHDDISRYLEDMSMSVEDSTLLRELTLFYRRHRTASNLTASFLVILVTAASLFLHSLNTSKNAASDARDQALDSLKQLEAEQRITEARLIQQAKDAQITSMHLNHLGFTDRLRLPVLVDKLHQQLDAVIANQPADEDPIWEEKFWLNFLTQQFDQAMELHEEGKLIAEDLLPAAKKYASRNTNTEYLSTGDFQELLSDLFTLTEIDRTPLMEKMIRYDLAHPRSSSDRLALAKTMLALLNPEWKNPVFNYSETEHSLQLSGNGLQRLSSRNNFPSILISFQPRKLDLKHSSVENLQTLKSLNLVEIDLRHTQVKSLKPLADMRTLSRVIVSPGQFTPAQLAPLPSYIEVLTIEEGS